MVNGMGLRGTAGKRGIALLALGLGVLLSGCMQQTIEPASDSNFTPRDRKLLASMRKLDQETLDEQLQPFLTKSEIKAVLARRDLIVKFFDDAVKKKGEGAVLYDLPARQ